MANLPLAFGEIVAGGIILLAGLSGKSIGQVMSGDVTLTPFAGGGATTSRSGIPNPIVIGTPNSKGEVNPIPGAQASRLDQGIDATGKTFVAPYNGTVVYSSQSDPGWKGGGYIAIANDANPSQVTYFAEGISPSFFKGNKVQAGQLIGMPSMNPYNGIIGNIELGPADPKNPGRPLAQAVGNPVQLVMNFYRWLLSLGGPHATSTGNAGHA